MSLSSMPANDKLVILDSNGGNLSILSLVTNDSGYLATLPSPIYEGYTFDGWFTAKIGGDKVTTETHFADNITIFAHWTQNPYPTQQPTGSHRPLIIEIKDKDTVENDGEAGEDSKIVNPFHDVKDSDYYYDAVLWAFKNNITSGTSENSFSPTDSCTRAQTINFLWRVVGSPEPQKAN